MWRAFKIGIFLSMALTAVASRAEEVKLSPLSNEVSCKEEIGLKKSEQLVWQCKFISPATHPPCHVLNSCGTIRSEIIRVCQHWANGDYGNVDFSEQWAKVCSHYEKDITWPKRH
jgi:hypothetical protein